ncbi:MAG: hypothetical protein ACFC1C_01030 [Candidatus Malihini olakiniferum]
MPISNVEALQLVKLAGMDSVMAEEVLVSEKTRVSPAEIFIDRRWA